MSVQYEFLFSVYSAPPFITEILMVLLVIVILGFPCTSYLSRYVCEKPVLPSEAPPQVGDTEIRRESSGVVIEELQATIPPEVSDTEIRPESSGVVIEELQATIPQEVGDTEIRRESSELLIDELVAVPPQVGDTEIRRESSGLLIEELLAVPPQVRYTAIRRESSGLQSDELVAVPPQVGDTEIRHESSGLLIEELLAVPPQVGYTAVRPESSGVVIEEREATVIGNHGRGLATEPGIHPEPGLDTEADIHPEPGHDIEPDPESEDDSDPTESSTDDTSADDSGSDNSGPNDPGPGGTGPNDPGPEEPGPEEPGPEEPGGYESSQDDIQGPTQMEVVVEVHRNRESLRQNTQGYNRSGVSRTQGTQRSIQVLYSISNYPELSHSETEEYQSPHHKYFRTDNSALENMFMEGNKHSVVHDIVGDSITPRNEIQRGKMGSLYKQQTGNISTGSAISKDFKFQNLIAEDSSLPPDTLRLKPHGLLSHKQETSSQGNLFTSVSSSPLFINKYKRKLADSLKMKPKGIKQRPNRRYTGTNASNKSQQFITCTEHLSDLSRLKQYELLKCKEETASQEKYLTSAICSPLFSNNSKQAGSLEMRLRRIHHSSKLAERNEPQKSQHFIPHTEHSLTDQLGKGYIASHQSHISKFDNWHHTKDDDLNNLPSMNENIFLKELSFPSSERENTDQEIYNYYNKALKGRCNFESKDSHDNYKGRYENADWIKTNANGPNTCCYIAEDKLGYLMKDRTHPLNEEDPKNDKDPFYFESYSQSERFQLSENSEGIGKFKSSSDVNDAESTVSDKIHKIRIEQARLVVELLKEAHYKNLRMKSKSKLQEKINYCPQFPSYESATHYPLGKANEQTIGDNNGKSVSETIKVSELKYFQTSTTNKKHFRSSDEEFDVHDM